MDFQGKLSFNGHRIDFQSSDLVCEQELIDTSGLRGTRSRPGERVRAGIRRVHGPIKVQPTSLEWTYLAQAIMGGTPAGTTYPLGDTLTSNDVVVDDKMQVMTYPATSIDKMTLHAGQEQQIVEATLDIVGKDETIGAANTFGGATIDETTFPFRFYDSASAISIGGVVYQAREMTIVIDNAVDKDRYFNSQTLVTVQPTDRHVHFTAKLPYGDAVAAYNLSSTGGVDPADTGAQGVAVSVVFTFGGASMSWTFPNVKFPRKSPHWAGREESFLDLDGICYSSGATAEASLTVVPGP